MPKELIYTSIREGLDIGRSGFCTVAKTIGMKKSLSTELESMSYYDFELSSRKHIFTYRQVQVASETFYVCSKISSCGVDYTGRTNFIAHHVVFDYAEINAYTNPADFILNWNGWLNSWVGQARELSPREFKPFVFRNTSESLNTWRQLSSEKNASFLLAAKYFLFENVDENSYLKLLSESFSKNKAWAWDFSFTTRLQKNEAMRKYQIVLSSALIRKGVDKDILRISPADFSLKIDFKTEKAEEVRSRDTSISFYEREQVDEQTQNFSTFTKKYSAPKKDNFVLYLCIASFVLSVSVLLIYVLFFHNANRIKADFNPKQATVAPKPRNDIQIFATKTEEIKPKVEIKEVEVEKVVEVEKPKEKPKPKNVKKEEKIVKKLTQDNENFLRILGVPESSIEKFEMLEGIFLALKNPDYKSYGFDAKTLNDNFDTKSIFDSEKYNIGIYVSVDKEIKIENKGKDLISQLDGNTKILFSTNNKIINAQLPILSTFKNKENAKEYAVYFVDNTSIPIKERLNDEFEIPESTKKALLSFHYRRGQRYDFEIKSDDEVLAKILKMADNDSNKIKNYLEEIEKDLKEYKKTTKNLGQFVKNKPKEPTPEKEKHVDYGNPETNKEDGEKKDIIRNIVYKEDHPTATGFLSKKASFKSRLAEHLNDARHKMDELIADEGKIIEKLDSAETLNEIKKIYINDPNNNTESTWETHKVYYKISEKLKGYKDVLTKSVKEIEGSIKKIIANNEKGSEVIMKLVEGLDEAYKPYSAFIKSKEEEPVFELMKAEKEKLPINEGVRYRWTETNLKQYIVGTRFYSKIEWANKKNQVYKWFFLNDYKKSNKCNLEKERRYILRTDTLKKVFEEYEYSEWNKGIPDRYNAKEEEFKKALARYNTELKKLTESRKFTEEKLLRFFSESDLKNKNIAEYSLTNKKELLKKINIFIKFSSN